MKRVLESLRRLCSSALELFKVRIGHWKRTGVPENEMRYRVSDAGLWLQAAEQGLDMAQYLLGICFANGTGVKKDLALAGVWLQRAAKQGHAEARAQYAEVLRALQAERAPQPHVDDILSALQAERAQERAQPEGPPPTAAP